MSLFDDSPAVRPRRAHKGEPRAWIERTLAERIRSDECWLDWPFSVSPLNYPKVHRTMASHLVLTLDGRPRPTSRHEACHSCPDGDNPLCLHPEHLRWDTHAANQRDMAERGRSTKGRATVRGEAVGNSKLTASKVAEIRRRYRPGVNQFDRGNSAALAIEYGVTQTTIGHIAKGTTWRT